jgi:hypothetical protein
VKILLATQTTNPTMGTTDRIHITAQLHMTDIFSRHIPDELTGDELLTYTNIEKTTYQRYRLVRTLVSNGSVEVLLDNSEVEIPLVEYRLFDVLQRRTPIHQQHSLHIYLAHTRIP